MVSWQDLSIFSSVLDTHVESLTEERRREIFYPRHTGLSPAYEHWVRENANLLPGERVVCVMESVEEQTARFSKITREDLEPFLPGSVPPGAKVTYKSKIAPNGYVQHTFLVKKEFNTEKPKEKKTITDTYRHHSKTPGAPQDSPPVWRWSRRISGHSIETIEQEVVRRTPDNFEILASFNCECAENYDGVWTVPALEWRRAEGNRNSEGPDLEFLHARSQVLLDSGHFIFIPYHKGERPAFFIRQNGSVEKACNVVIDYLTGKITNPQHVRNLESSLITFAPDTEIDSSFKEALLHLRSDDLTPEKSLGLLLACIFQSQSNEIFEQAVTSLAFRSRGIASRLMDHCIYYRQLGRGFDPMVLVKIAPFLNRDVGVKACIQCLQRLKNKPSASSSDRIVALDMLFAISAEDGRCVAAQMILQEGEKEFKDHARAILTQTTKVSVSYNRDDPMIYSETDVANLISSFEIEGKNALSLDDLFKSKILTMRILEGNEKVHQAALWAGAFDPFERYRVYCREKLGFIENTERD